VTHMYNSSLRMTRVYFIYNDDDMIDIEI